MKYLKPLIMREAYFSPIEAEIQRIFNEMIYQKIFNILGIKEYLNAVESLQAAIRAGRIWYVDGEFKGKFSAKTTIELRSIGATYSAASRTWFLIPARLPAEIMFAQAQADQKLNEIRKRILNELRDIDVDQLSFRDNLIDRYDRTIDLIETDFKSAAKEISIPMTLNKVQKATLANDYTQNLDLYIKGWIDENIPKLRKKVQENAFAGGRAEALVSVILENYDTSRAKAKFLARQETSLLMSKFQQSRFQEGGVEEYRWSGADDERERPDHRKLNGKIFRFKSPPITNRKTGARNNPGEDYNCRCIAVPIVR